MRAQCCICADLFVSCNETNIAATPCGHVFHEHCLARWLLTSSTCPSCRKKVVQNAVIPKLFFDIAEEEADEADPAKLSNELQTLRTKVVHLEQKKAKHKSDEKALKNEAAKKQEEVENLRVIMRREQDDAASLRRLLQNFEAQQQVHKEERAEFLRAKRKLEDFKNMETLISGGVKESEDLLQQYGSGDRGSVQQLSRYAAIIKREYEQAKVEKRALKEQLDALRKAHYAATRDQDKHKTSLKALQEKLVRSEDDLKQAEKLNIVLRAKVSKLKFSSKHPAQSSGSFLETPERQNLSSGNVFNETPKLDKESFVSPPTMSRPSGSGLISLEDEGQDSDKLNQSLDLFAESPQTQMRKTCEENNMRVVKITSAAANKRVKRPQEEDWESSFPLSSFNIMKKRQKQRQLQGSSVSRKDYDGFGGTSSFVQPLGPPKFIAPKRISMKKAKPGPGGRCPNPKLPTLDGFFDLT